MSRVTTFTRWWVHQLRTYDCDPSIYLMKYIIDRMELNLEQRYWFCWIYANTYHVPTAWVIFNEFPDYENVPQDRIARFSTQNAARLPYQKDQKWLRGCLGETFASYKENMGLYSQAAFWEQFIVPNNPRQTFTKCWEMVLKSFYKFGRYTAWFYLQALKEVCGLPLEPTSLMLGFDASATHRAGLCLALGQDDWAVKGTKFDQRMLMMLDIGAQRILTDVKGLFDSVGCPKLPVEPDYFSMETACCSFKKLFRREQGRYLGFYLDRMAEDIIKTQRCDWPGINWQLLWDARDEILLPELNNTSVDKTKFNLFLDHGKFHTNEDLMARLDNWL